MPPTLDERVAHLVSRAHLLERAVHSADGWSISRSGREAPAIRELMEDRVVFTVHFQAPGEYGPDSWLFHHGECLSYLRVPPITIDPGRVFTFSWELVIEDSVAA
jgi:hypothetical protein